MTTKIIYTKRDQKTVLNETDLNENKIYLKHLYSDEILDRIERYHSGNLFGIDVYYRDEKTSDEETLFENIFISTIKIVREKKQDGYILFHEKTYVKLILEDEVFRIEDTNGRVISIYKVDKKEKYSQKTLYSATNDALTFDYFNTGAPLLKKIEVERQLEEFSKLHKMDVPKSYYLSFFPFIPSGYMSELENCTYFSSFNKDREITLQQAFFERDFIKKIQSNGILKCIEYFNKFKISAKSYFIYDGEPVDVSHLYTELHYLKEKKNGFTKWEVKHYRNGILNETLITVFDLMGKSIFMKSKDYDGNVEFYRKRAYYYDSQYSRFENFDYNSVGELISESIDEEDGWHGIKHSIRDLKDAGFFDSEYGKYFLNGLPEIPELSNPVVSYELIYKNHLDEVITKSEADHLYEYSKESFENGKLVKRIHCKAVSKEDFKEKHYNEYIESYHDDVKEITNLEDFTEGRNKIFYNKRVINNYNVYDFIVRNDDDWNTIKFIGTTVYDNYYRLISNVIYNENSKNIISGTKIFYPHISPLLGSNGITVSFNNRGEAISYTERSLGSPRFFSRELFEKESFFHISPVNNEYYRNITELIPEKQAFPFFDFEWRTLQYAKERANVDTVQFLSHESKLRIAFLGTYTMYYFLDNREELNVYLNTLQNEYSNVFFYHIEKKTGVIEADCFYPIGIEAHFIIDLETRTIQCEILNPKGEVQFEILNTNEYTDYYSFWHQEERLWALDFEAEILIELLSKT